MKLRSKKEAGNMFREIRLSKNLTLEQLADMTDDNLTAEQIDLYEKGEDALPLIGFILMCQALEIEDPDEILYEEI
ncbi:MAG: helix-turn-helix domain-containing protein [Clostridia bacterium]|nr:helix-turn-helix domain-containing protein [Clostridia bacterium]MEE0410183.1 helix-turn-helix domain-containing protein [Clostridia bacterium]